MPIRLDNIEIKKGAKEDRKINPIRIDGNLIIMNKEVKNKKIPIDNNNVNNIWERYMELGEIGFDKAKDRNYANVNNFWNNQPCYVVGCGKALEPIIKNYGLEFLNNKHTIGINHIIEDYDKFEWHLFLDKRFLEKTTYDINNFMGRFFAQNNTGLSLNKNECLFKCNPNKPSKIIEDGLYSPNLSGLCALNLAIIAGANPIYLLGFGEGAHSDYTNYHYKKNYTGEVKSEITYTKFQNVKRYYAKFNEYVSRIIHITDGHDIPEFKKLNIQKFAKLHKLDNIKKQEIIKISQLPKIVHYSFSNDLNLHNELNVALINKGHGYHILRNINDPIENADLYILEHWLSTDKQIKNFPYKAKAIDIVHTVNCIPEKGFKKVVCLTNTWKKYLSRFNINAEVVTGGIDLDNYKNIIPDYNKKVFGRITKWSPAKIHPEWNKICLEVLEQIKDSKCLIYTHLENVSQRSTFIHPRMVYDKSVTIDMKNKGEYLKNMSVYCHFNGSFKDTLSLGVIEAMATGLPILYLNEDVIAEVTGNAGVNCANINDMKIKLIKFLSDIDLREEFGTYAKRQAKKYNINNFVNGMNKIIKDCLK